MNISFISESTLSTNTTGKLRNITITLFVVHPIKNVSDKNQTHREVFNGRDQVCGSGSALFLEAGSGSTLKSKFQNFRGSTWRAVETHNGGLEAQNGALEGL
jgi:hypothetical protein